MDKGVHRGVEFRPRSDEVRVRMAMPPSLLVKRCEDDENQLCPPIMLASGMLVYICCFEEDVALENSA